MSNRVTANKRITGVVLLLIVCAVMALFGIYPTNYESLFTPLNKGIDFYAYFCLALGIILLIPNVKVPGEKTISNISFVHMTLTVGIACAFFSWCADPSGITNTGTDRNPYSVIGFWYGPWEWLMFLPFILVEIYDVMYKLPKWLSTIRMYVMAVSMMLGIAISMMAGCTTIPKLAYALWGVEISPFLLLIPFSALISISLIRGIHKGMKLFSNITMGLMYFIAFNLLISSIGPKFLPQVGNVWGEMYTNFFSWMNFSGSEFEIKSQYPYWVWGISWSGIIPPFIRKISEGRSLRLVILLFTIGVSIICQGYAVLASTAFEAYGGNGINYFADHSWLAFVYIIMLIMMFVTSADSTCFSLDEMVSKGIKAPVAYRKLMWIGVMALFVSILLISGGGTTDAIYGISYIMVPMLLIICFIGLGLGLNKYIKLKKHIKS